MEALVQDLHAAASLKRKRVGYALVASAAIGWGSWPLILRHAPMPAALQSAILMTVVCVGSLPVMLRDRLPVRARPKHWLLVGCLGISDSMNTILFFAAYQRTTVAISVLTHYLTPIFVALAAPIVLGEKLKARTLESVAIAFCGLVLLLQPWRADLTKDDLVGAALGAGSAVFYASNVLVNKKLAPVFSGSELMVFHGIVAVPFLWALVPAHAMASVPSTSLLTILVCAVGVGAVGGLAFVWGLRRVEASHASILTLLEPFVAVLVGAVFLGQTLGLVPVFGGILILIGAVLVVAERPAPRRDGVD